MAYSARRRTTGRSSTARRSNSPRRRVSRAGAGSRRSSGNRKAPVRQQVVKIVVEQLPPSQIARPEGGPLQTIAPPPARSKF